MIDAVDIQENEILSIDCSLLDALLIDRTMSYYQNKICHIRWATKNYETKGLGYQEHDEIQVELITGKNANVIQPRIKKTKVDQKDRSREKAEVFTPAWICNRQNNLIDNQWFGRTEVFNIELPFAWETTKTKVVFSKNAGKTWKDYVSEPRMEITCGEAPYLTSRYDTLTGQPIPITDRIGLLDRKLRIVSENVANKGEWYKWAIIAYKSIYAFEWQGDNLLLARENLLYTFIHNYVFQFKEEPSPQMMKEVAEIISWNIWQMDGIKGVIPGTCHEENGYSEELLFSDLRQDKMPCQGCTKGDIYLHNGYKCLVMDWDTNKPIQFISLINRTSCHR